MKPRTRTTRRAGLLLAAGLLVTAAAGASGAGGAGAAATPPSEGSKMTSNAAGGPFGLDQLKPLALARIGAWKRASQTFPMESSALPGAPTVVSVYRNGASSAKLTLTDAGGDASANDAAQWKGPPNRRETDDGREFVYRESRHTVREIERRQAPAREVMLLLPNGLVVSASGDGVEMAALKALAAGVPLAAAETLVRPAR
jgi:hypothetical protein